MRDLTVVSVRDLAEFVHRRGDLFEPGGRVTADEGIKGQAKLQKQRPSGYVREVALSDELAAGGLQITLRGRADGVDLEAGLVEEIKASRRWPDGAAAEHRAQAMLYAALLSRRHPQRAAWQVQVTYVDPDSSDTRSFTERASALELADFLQATLLAWTDWVCARLEARSRRDAWLRDRQFPLPTLRPWQGAVMRRCAAALAAREALLLEAPTGSGKTLAVTWPAVRALPAASRIFFLTSRSTGAAAALHALGLIDGQSGRLTRIVLTAREKICPVPGTPCDPAVCPYARGYYDRSRAGVVALLQMPQVTADEVSRVAQDHQVCPFELSLDASVWFDVVIGDYNYIFDPVVRLRRFAGDADAILLVDEAHQLAPRVRAALGAVLSRSEVRAAQVVAPAGLLPHLRALDRQLLVVGRQLASTAPGDAGEAGFELPARLLSVLQELVEATARWRRDNLLPLAPAVEVAALSAWRFQYLSTWFGICPYVFLAEGEGTDLTVHARCLDAAAYLQGLWQQSGPCIRFSATASPPEIYQASHGVGSVATAAAFARAGSPFDPGQLAVLVVPDIDTRWRGRERSMPRLVALLQAITSAHPGRYLMCFPSYRYLQQFADGLGAAGADSFVAQTPGADTTMLEQLAARPAVVLGIVLGGTLSESIDLITTPLAGVIVVGVAQSPPSAELDLAARHFVARGLDGQLMAYIQPGMSKIVQAAGRLIRTHEHRGVLVLVDHRFQAPRWRQFFPSLWNPRTVPAASVGPLVRDFWTPQ